MRRHFLRVFAIAGLMGLAALQGCATRVKATALDNPPPTEAFKAFGRIEVQPLRVADGIKASPAGVAKIQENLTKDLSTALPEWNAGPDNGRKLTILPVLEQLQFTHGAKRILLGPLAGSSGVLLRLRIIDDKGRVVATPEFFQRADAMAAGFVMGVHDNIMLTRVANLASGYVLANYSVAKGGPTGADDKALAPATATAK
ncbi:hypothetical protein ACFJIX_05440 [Roseateles sp. UC29_93]|uniref:hypothetical protein n=1 Tax=Roseateles sp. UC29_93 TaxID=3350177 RepID=UPI003673396A